MGWTIERHRVGNNQQELKVSIIVREMIDTWSTDSGGWCGEFTKRISEIPRTNNYAAQYGYRAIPKGLHIVEVWKMKVNGDLNYKMYTVKYKK